MLESVFILIRGHLNMQMMIVFDGKKLLKMMENLFVVLWNQLSCNGKKMEKNSKKKETCTKHKYNNLLLPFRLFPLFPISGLRGG